MSFPFCSRLNLKKKENFFNFNLGGLFGICFEVEGGGKITPSCLKLGIWHLSTDPYVILEDIPFSIKTLLILLMSAFICEKLAFFGQNSTFTESNNVRAF